MTDMAAVLTLQPDGKAGFTATGDLSIAGHYEIGLLVRTRDNQLHRASIALVTGT
jgi:hypothetical protein